MNLAIALIVAGVLIAIFLHSTVGIMLVIAGILLLFFGGTIGR